MIDTKRFLQKLFPSEGLFKDVSADFFTQAAGSGWFSLCQDIIDHLEDKNPLNGALHSAAEKGHLEICKLIAENVDFKNPSDLRGNTPLHLAATKGHLEVCKFLIESVP